MGKKRRRRSRSVPESTLSPSACPWPWRSRRRSRTDHARTTCAHIHPDRAFNDRAVSPCDLGRLHHIVDAIDTDSGAGPQFQQPRQPVDFQRVAQPVRDENIPCSAAGADLSVRDLLTADARRAAQSFLLPGHVYRLVNLAMSRRRIPCALANSPIILVLRSNAPRSSTTQSVWVSPSSMPGVAGMSKPTSWSSRTVASFDDCLAVFGIRATGSDRRSLLSCPL